MPPQLRGTAFRGSAAVRDGLLTPAQLRSSPWRRLFTGVYVHEDVEVTHAVRARAAAGWRVVFVTGADLQHPAQLVTRLAAVLG